MFAEVAIPLYVFQTFTYALPASFAHSAKAGARVLVPFGKQLITAYIVALHETLAEAGQEVANHEVKEVEELFDTEPLVTAEMLELSKWITDYYYAPWGEVIKCCLPAGINAEAETYVSITNEGRSALTTTFAKRPDSSKAQVLEKLAAEGLLKASELAKEFSKNRATALIRELEKDGYVSVTRQVQQASVKPKRQQAVRLLERAPIEGSKPLNELQERVIKLLFDAGGTLSFAQLTEQAAVSPSVIRTLEKRNYVEVFIREVRRDPLAHLKNNGDGNAADGLTLTKSPRRCKPTTTRPFCSTASPAPARPKSTSARWLPPCFGARLR
jgi:primosomal protein N' (replication factor Y) (superfamily II helicase)